MTNCKVTIRPYENRKRNRRALSLVEIMAVLVVVSMMLMALMAVFNRAKNATASVNQRLDQYDASMEVLQRIAEDLDRIAISGYNMKVTVTNKIVDGFNKSQLIIQSDIYGKNGKLFVFEKVVWQSHYDTIEYIPVLYRAHYGINLDDKILSLAEDQLDEKEKKPFVPVCYNMTFFEFVIPRKNAEPLKQWTSKKLPPAINVAISFAPPTELLTGEFKVLDEDKKTRTIAINRTKKLGFVFIRKKYEITDLNSMDDVTDPNESDNTNESNAINELDSKNDQQK